MHLIEKILNAQPCQLILQFKNGEVRVVNLEEQIKALVQKTDARFDAMQKKIDTRFQAIDDKLDKL